MNSRKPVSIELARSRRIRQTPFEQRVFEQGARAFTVYNHMPLAVRYASLQEDYEHLCAHVQIWDVSCQRQVEVNGPDALKLLELVTPRDLSKCQVGQCMYAPLVDEQGGIVNDPIIIRLTEQRFWVSIAASDVLLWLKGIAYGRGFDADVFEPEVSPLAIQGPKSDDLMAELLGEQIRDIRFFWFAHASLAGTDFIIARSGWSGQGGFEIYLQDSSKGLDLWDTIWEAGQKYKIRAGCPNLIDRIESGLLSYGNDMTLANNPYEVGLGRFLEKSKAAECMSASALAEVIKNGPLQELAFIAIDGDKITSAQLTYDVLDDAGNVVGMVTSLAFSKKFGANLAFATIDAKLNIHGGQVQVDCGEDGLRSGVIRDRFWK